MDQINDSNVHFIERLSDRTCIRLGIFTWKQITCFVQHSYGRAIEEICIEMGSISSYNKEIHRKDSGRVIGMRRTYTCLSNRVLS